MKRLISAMCGAVLAIFIGTVAANSQGGQCPVGTCAKDGGILAANLKNCRASNCAKKTSNTGSRSQCCQAWYGRCVAQNYPAANCASLQSGCNRSGVFAFRTGNQPRC